MDGKFRYVKLCLGRPTSEDPVTKTSRCKKGRIQHVTKWYVHEGGNNRKLGLFSALSRTMA
jgi:hypothetical protein